MINVDFGEYGRVYVRINIKPYDNITMLPLEFKVDTGADTTTISKAELEKLGYDMEWIKQNATDLEAFAKVVHCDGQIM